MPQGTEREIKRWDTRFRDGQCGVLLGAALDLVLGKREEEPMVLAKGKKAPAFALNDAAGNRVALKDFLGQEVVLYFYPRDNTSGCTKEAQGFKKRWKKLSDRGVAVIGISPDSVESHQRFAAQHRLPFVLLSDPDRKVMKRYSAFGKKVLYGKKTEGVIRSTVWIGADGRIKKHWPAVRKAADHPEAVWTAIAADEP